MFGRPTPPFLACGGAPVSRRVLTALADRGIVVYEGYGLSENTSVVSWNTPAAHRPGSVGRPLEHVRVRLAPDGELLVRSSSLFAGYTTDDPTSLTLDAEGWLHTGDLAEIDDDGYLFLRGRKKNIVITSTGRNVAVDWVAARYREVPGVLAAAVLGDGLDELVGLLVVSGDLDEVRAAAIRYGETQLSDFERVRRLTLIAADDPRVAGLFTVTGRPVADRIKTLIDADVAVDIPPAINHREFPMLDTIDVRQHGTDAGRILFGARGQQLDTLNPTDVVALLQDSGYLVFRGFDTTVDRFNAFVRSLSSEVIADPAREFFGEAAQKVDAGMQPVGLHLENGNSPFRPDLTWFYCLKAARAGSQTTVCDGYRVWKFLSEEARAAFTSQEIVYARNVPERAWKKLAAHLLGGSKPYADITLDDLRTFVREPDRTEVRHHGDGSVYYAHREPAVRRPTLFGDAPAWANSIFGPSVHYEKPRITFADGSEIPSGVLKEALRVTDDVTEQVDWCDGDVVLIDNSRVMHGRREIVDPQRAIFNAQSNIDRALLPADRTRKI
jgi:hypothetical protein